MTEIPFVLPTGRLTCRLTSQAMPLASLLGLAPGRDPQHPYTFIAKVTGRHWPTRPCVMRHIFLRFCSALLQEPAHQGLPGPVWMLGLAESGILLAGGVGNTLAQTQHREDVFFQHTSELLPSDLPLLVLDTPGTPPYLHHPRSEVAGALWDAKTLVLADEHVTPEHPLLELAERLGTLPLVAERLILLSLANWLDPAARHHASQRIQAAWHRAKRPPPAITWCSLLAGTLDYQRRDAVTPPAAADTLPRRRTRVPSAPEHLGRRGLYLPLEPPLNALQLVPGTVGTPPGELPAVAVIGTGEYVLQPYLAALRLADHGVPVNYQSVTREPLLTGGDLAGHLLMPDPYLQGRRYYLHNPPDHQLYQRVVLYETPEAANRPHRAMRAMTLRCAHGH